MSRLRKVFAAIIITLLLTSWIVGDINKKREEKRMEQELIQLEKVVIDLEKRHLIKKEKLRKHYDVNLFFNDYSKENQELTTLYNQELFKEFNEVFKTFDDLNIDFFLQSKIEFYNQVLEAYSNDEISFDEIYEDKGDSVKEITIELYTFKSDRYVNNDFETYINELIQMYYNEFDINLELVSRVISKDALEKKSMIDYASLKYPFLELVVDEFIFSVKYYTLNDIGIGYSNIFGNDTNNEMLDRLEERHNEEFVALYDRDSKSSTTYAPLRNFDERFEADYIGDRFTAIHVQKYVTDRVKDILKKHGLEDKVLVFSTPSFSRNNDEPLYKMEYGYLDEDDDLDLVNNRIGSDVETSLYYMYEENEDIDYKRIKTIIDEYKELYKTTEEHYFTIAVFFVEISGDDQRIANELFKNKDYTEGSFGNYELFDISQFFIKRTDHEGFDFIDYFGNIDDNYLRVNETIKHLSADEMLRGYSREN